MAASTRVTAALTGLSLLLLIAACDSGSTSQPPSTSPASSTETAAPAEVGLPIPNPFELYVGAVDGTGVRLVHASDRQLQYAWSADGGMLAVEEGDETSTTVRILDLEGNEQANYSHYSYYPRPLIWSPDGRYIVTTFRPADKDAVLVMASDGSGQHPFSSFEEDVFALMGWLPSGELMVFDHTGMTSGELFALDLEAESSRRLTDVRVVPATAPVVSPDGATLALLGWAGAEAPCRDSKAVLFTINIETGVGRHLTQSPGCGTGGIVWSPDGTQIAFSSLSIADRMGLFTVDVETGDTERLTTGNYNVVAWLEDGTILAHDYHCLSCGLDPPRVVAIDPRTGDVSEIAGFAPNAVAPDGRIAIVRDASIQMLDRDGAKLANIGGTEAGWQYHDVTLAPGGAHVAYQRSRLKGLHYFQVNADGSDFKKLGLYPIATRLSPDLQRLAYAELITDSHGGPLAALFLADADGSNAQQLPLEIGVDHFAWSPDSSRLVFNTRDPFIPGAAEYIVQGEGSGMRTIDLGAARGEPRSWPPVWAPNGKLVLFLGALGTIVDVDSGAIRQFTIRTDGVRNLPTWSNDSSKIIYAIGGEPDVAGVYVFDLATTQTIRIAVNGIPVGPLAVSPDGRRIAYYLTDRVNSGRQTLQVVNVDGTNDKTIMEYVSSVTSPAWSPDGERLAGVKTIGADRGLFTVNADGSGAKPLTLGGDFDEIRWTDDDRIVVRTYIENIF